MSVEEILKSIKEVINNHNSQDNDDILELTHIIDNKTVLDNTKKLSQSLCNDLNSKNAQTVPEPLISRSTGVETTNILQNFSKIAGGREENTTDFKAKILEDLIVELLRPQLTKWLDQNLPLLVKQLVAQEIQRLMPNNQK